MVFGIVLVVVGAMMKFAVTAHAHGFKVHEAGLILLLVGIAIFILSLVLLVLGGMSRSTMRTDVRETPAGQQRTERHDDWGTP